MSFEAYLANIKAKTGKTPGDFRAAAATKGLLQPGVKPGQIVAWLKQDYDLGHGHAMAIVEVLRSSDVPAQSVDERVVRHFPAGKAHWKAAYDRLVKEINQFGPDVNVSPTSAYISLLQGDKKFAIVAVGTKQMDIGIKLRGAEAVGRLAAAGAWNTMVSHRVTITSEDDLDTELVRWLELAYERA